MAKKKKGGKRKQGLIKRIDSKKKKLGRGGKGSRNGKSSATPEALNKEKKRTLKKSDRKRGAN